MSEPFLLSRYQIIDFQKWNLCRKFPGHLVFFTSCECENINVCSLSSSAVYWHGRPRFATAEVAAANDIDTSSSTMFLGAKKSKNNRSPPPPHFGNAWHERGRQRTHHPLPFTGVWAAVPGRELLCGAAFLGTMTWRVAANGYIGAVSLCQWEFRSRFWRLQTTSALLYGTVGAFGLKVERRQICSNYSNLYLAFSIGGPKKFYEKNSMLCKQRILWILSRW